MNKYNRITFALIFFLGITATPSVWAQIIIKNGQVDTCGGIFYDSGGENGTFSHLDNFTFTICSNDPIRNHIALGFDLLDIGNTDTLCFYDGNNINTPILVCSKDSLSLIALKQNSIIQVSSDNISGCITIQFRAKRRLFGNLFNKGWAANILCIPNCQNIKAVIESTNPPIVPLDTGWIDACPNLTKVNFKAKGIYPENGKNYTQNDVLNKFEWNFGDSTAVAYGTDVTHIFDKSGGYNVRLTITDTLGCQNTTLIKQRVRVSPKPVFSVNKLPSQVCIGTPINLKAKSDGIDNTYVVSLKKDTARFKFNVVRSGRLFIPDSAGQEYKTSIRFTDFSSGQTLTNINDLLGIFIDMEHSWGRDLEIKIVCPSLQTAILHKYDVGTRNINEIHIGTPNENDALAPFVNDSTRNTPGSSKRYEWVPAGAANTWRSFSSSAGIIKLPAGKYRPDDTLTKLIGCPLNGEWSLVAKDQFKYDNGWIFAWGINFKNNLYPPLESFTPNIVEHSWVKKPYTTAYTGDDMTVKPIHAGVANLTYRIKDDYNCVFDTSLNLKILPPTSPLCVVCNIDTFFHKMKDTLICVSNNTGVTLDKTLKKSPNLSIPFDAYPDAVMDATTNPVLSPFVSKVPISSITPTTITNPLSQIESVCFDIGTFESVDMVVELQSPTGQKVRLFNQWGSRGILMKIFVFSPKATRDISTASSPYNGVYQLQGGAVTWNSLIGSTIAGDWQLLVSDGRGLEKDTLKQWSITFINQNGFKYAWTPTENISCTNCPNPKVTPSVSTTYTVEITDSMGCKHIDSIRINVIDSLSAPVASVENISFTFMTFGWLPITGASGYEVSINNGAWIVPDGSLSHLVSNLRICDIVYFKVRATGGICGAKIASLTQATRACMISIGTGINRRLEIDSILCNGEKSPRVNFAYANGIAPMTYIIDSLTQPLLPIFIDKLRAGNHTAILIDSSGCRDTLKFTMFQPAPISLALTSLDTKCNGNLMLLTTNTTESNLRIDWLKNGQLLVGQNQATLLVSDSGTYTVRVRRSNGCDSFVTRKYTFVPIAPPIVNDTSICQNSNALLWIRNNNNAAYKMYQWSSSTATNASITVTPSVSSTYFVTVTDANGCTGVDSAIVTVNPLPILNFTNLVNTYCRTSTPVLLTATPNGGTFRLDGGNANVLNFTPSVLANGNHTVSYTYQDANLCSNTLTRTISVLDTIKNIFKPTICVGDSLLINGKVYNLSKPTGTEIFKGASVSGCDSVVLVQLSFSPKPNAINDVYNITSGQNNVEMLVLSNDSINQKDKAIVTTFRQPTQGNLNYLGFGKYRYIQPPFLSGIVTFAYKICDNVCINVCDTATVTINFINTSRVGKTDQSLAITPNEDLTNDELIFDELLNNPKKYPQNEIVIANRWGQVIYQAKPYNNDWKGTNQSGQPLPAGTYYYIMRLDINEGKVITGDITVIR